MNTFDNISGQYKEKSLVQQKASLKLLDLLKVGCTDSVIDVACGTGHITNLLSKVTGGRVVGIDVSEGMIKQAKALYPGIEFRQVAAEDMDYDNEFDIAFCNSALPWFRDPAKAIKAVFNSLKKSGRLGLACPGTSDWKPWDDRIISNVVQNEMIKPVFSHWKDPWFRLQTMNDYKLFFEKQGFSTVSIEVAYEQTYYSIEDAFNIYLSATANGYTGKEYYDIKIDDNYISAFNSLVKEEIKNQSKGGEIKVDFNRLYYIGKK